MEIQISRKARTHYRIEPKSFSSKGTAFFETMQGARELAELINRRRDLARHPERVVTAGQVHAMGLIEEILRYIVGLYHESKNPQATGKSEVWLRGSLGREKLDGALTGLVDEFPPPGVGSGPGPASAWLDGSADTEAVPGAGAPDAFPAGLLAAPTPNRHIALEELLMLRVANANPAYAPFRDLHDEVGLVSRTAYAEVCGGLRTFFDTQPPFGPDDQNLVDMLRAPAVASPDSLFGQLEFIWKKWGYLLAKFQFLFRLLRALDLLREEQAMRFLGPGLAEVYDFAHLAFEPERFSADRDWMPRCILLAKNAFVWLEQLSKRHGRWIRTLDDVPDEDLDTLARWGITGLWLIGLWERSPASRRIKQMRGNPEANASAYSLFEYRIADELGGETALQGLKERAWRRGIRLASDMVPNHMGIDSPWVMNHPDWFLSLDRSPFPSYSFHGQNLSWDERVGIQIEDHYFDGTDAAVVFRRVDHWSGTERFIYHGNDGTSMPWNDTAQINYLNPEAREAVIRTILDVAHRFPIIRFDAAMTLAKKHYQRLWFPEPGSGGAIPSRAEHGLARKQFDERMPEEFWREVVDRVAQEAPDTLLLAEAFWLMEGYFVRTLGMHRVYNSAFMNMLRDEDNAKYRSVIKNTIEFDPEILKRYVNFMNNPDEKTAVEQFGKGDKYLGICTLMVTLPGLPMFGHGQIEGFDEKYGMEFRKAQRDEVVDQDLVARHEREIFPLLHRRGVFAEVRNFLLYDFYTTDGTVNEDVFAYSNRAGGARALVVYLNRFSTAAGWIRTSAAFAAKGGGEGDKTLVQRSLAEGLELRADPDHWAIFRDHVSGLEFIRNCRELHEKGLYLELKAYGRHVFVDFREVRDDARGHYGQLAGHLAGRGAPSIEDAWKELFLRPLHEALRKVVSVEILRRLATRKKARTALLDEVEAKSARFVRELKTFAGGTEDERTIASRIRRALEAALSLPGPADDAGAPAFWGTLYGWIVLHALGGVQGEAGADARSRAWIEELLLGRIIEGPLREFMGDEGVARRAVETIRVLVTHQQWTEDTEPADENALPMLQSLVVDEGTRRLIGVNRHEGVLWFHKESFEGLMDWLPVLAAVSAAKGRVKAAPGGRATSGARKGPGADRASATRAFAHWAKLAGALKDAAGESGYRLERLVEIVARMAPPPGPKSSRPSGPRGSDSEPQREDAASGSAASAKDDASPAGSGAAGGGARRIAAAKSSQRPGGAKKTVARQKVGSAAGSSGTSRKKR